MGSFMKMFVGVVFAIGFFVNIASADPFQEAAKQGVNVAADMANSAIDLAKTAANAMGKVPLVGEFPGAQQMTNIANGAAGMAKGLVNSFKEMAAKASDMIPTSNQQSSQK
ncbi:uncharacterized protein LOC123319968 [Coccinella septempunctata]|uniref:uncharacterized protein LOC123319968 n=1 Tax=Coccinella septempunctata TaxID=41139 RepID=UPI001D085F01|nr:uncharacterized protein LOC123319968 [Coccinella septempunctata]